MAKAKANRSGANARSGPTVPEDQRDAIQVKLRLTKRQVTALDKLAERWGVTRSAAVVQMVESFK